MLLIREDHNKLFQPGNSDLNFARTFGRSIFCGQACEHFLQLSQMPADFLTFSTDQASLVLKKQAIRMPHVAGTVSPGILFHSNFEKAQTTKLLPQRMQSVIPSKNSS
jgi:hypothetical protein